MDTATNDRLSGLASHHCWPPVLAVCSERQAAVAAIGISGCAARRARPCGWRRCTWTSAGNIINESGLRLIDWEYAGDGAAMELAAVWISPASAVGWWWCICPAGVIDAQLLWQVTALWRP